MAIRDIQNETTGKLFRARILRKGDKFGLDMCLTHTKDEALIEFYDADRDFDTSPEGEPLGQFIGQYYVDTLTGEDGFKSRSVFSNNTGLDLDGGVDKWKIDAAGMAEVELFLLDEGLISDLSSPIALEKNSKRMENVPEP